MDLKKIGKAVLYPHVVIMMMLVPVSTVFLVYSMVFVGSDSLPAIVSYVLSAYTMTVWCIRLPDFVRFFKALKRDNKYVKLWHNDARLRVNVSLYGTLALNTAYAVLQLGLGFWHNTFWYYSLALYYILLALMRFFLVSHTRKYKPGEKMGEELKKYRLCGIAFLVMNLALSLIIFFMIYWDRSFIHHEITTIAMAAYTFTAFTAAVINFVKYRKYKSPVFSASKAINLASACVSVITLESTMLTTFDDGSMDGSSRTVLLALSGAGVCVFIIVMAVLMIVRSSKELRHLNKNHRS